MKSIIVIPARYASTRLPGKPLLHQTGKYLIQHAYETALRCAKSSDAIVATDDERIAAAVRGFGGKVVMTSGEHASGTDRIAEAVAGIDADVVVNLQGDEPEMPPENIDRLIALFEDDESLCMATLGVRISGEGYDDPGTVKIALDADSNALYFSRSPLPCWRDEADRREFVKHMGIYAYRKDFLAEFAAWPHSPLETAEKLEQLRALENGVKIRVALVENDCAGIDTREDYEKFCQRYKR